MSYVLSTRPLSTASIEEAAAGGIIIDVLPFIGTERILTRLPEELTNRPLTAVFTSSNAVIEGAERPDWKIFCLEGATRRAVAARFGETTIAGVAASAKELAAKIAGEREIWFFCGDRRREELPDTLQQAGVTVHEVVVYRTTLTPHKLEKTYDAIIFFSPSAVDSFFSVNTIDPHVPLFAIGRTTATALTQQCPNPVLISEQPDETILIRQLIKSIDEHTQE